MLSESGFDLDYCNVLYIGGGATIDLASIERMLLIWRISD